MTIYGYARTSARSQNILRQIESLKKVGCEKIFQDQQSGKDDSRPAFQELMKTVKKGDTIYIHELDRFMRSTKHFLMTIDELRKKGVVLKSIKDKWLDTSEDNPFAEMMMTIFSALAEYERKIIRQRQKEGIELAKTRGTKFGRPKKYTEKNKALEHAIELYKSKQYTVKEIEEITSVPRSSLYYCLKKFQNS